MFQRPYLNIIFDILEDFVYQGMSSQIEIYIKFKIMSKTKQQRYL